MLRNTALIVCLLPVLAAGQTDAPNPWKPVTEIKSGTDLRIVRKGTAQPILAVMDEADDERIVVVIKNEQVAIPRADILRLDARPKQTGSRVTKTTTNTVTHDPPDLKPQPGPRGAPGPTMSSGTSYSMGSKPDFQTVYRRPTDRLPSAK